MTGRVFKDSADIYEDQAKILFNYYRQAAEKIVSEEMNIEQNKRDLETKNLEIQKQIQSAKIRAIVGGGLALLGVIFLFLVTWLGIIILIGGAVLGIISLVQMKKSEKDLNDNVELSKIEDEKFKNIRRDYSVDKIGVVYVPIATRVPFDDKSFLIDHTNSSTPIDLHMTMLHQAKEFKESIKDLNDSITSIPMVEQNEDTESIDVSEYSTSIQNVTLHDYVGNIDRQIRNVSYLLNDSERVGVNIPVIVPNSDLDEKIKIYATTETEDNPVIDVFQADFSKEVTRLSEINSLANQLGDEDDVETEDYTTHTMKQLADTISILSKTRNFSSSKLAAYTGKIFSTVLKSGYTEYSPQLEAEEIEKVKNEEYNYSTSVNEYTPFTMKPSSRVKYDIFSNNWVADDGTRTSLPFSMHQIDEEIFMPVITSLMQENRIERLKIYNNIEDQKRAYLDKWISETGDYFRDNRKAADELITHMKETYAEYITASNMHKSLEKTMQQMETSSKIEDSKLTEENNQEEIIASFEVQAQECNNQQQEFADFLDRVQDDINDTTKRFQHMEYFEGSLREAVSHDTAVAHAEIHDLDDRRKTLISISPYMAKFAQLPPKPNMSTELEDDMQIDLEEQVNHCLNSNDAE